uniref:Peptide BmKn1 n=2 Tax=Buthidae TaxID=6856 RepID=NDB4U_OLIMR|nr:RecName: Full=Peptide BmKn1; AltName: Full=Biologically active peptide 4; AltName: Full=Non-disulfide-bridged peptide 5.1; Short=NDBP-5.1; Flags: Precursor [Mesobuthus martensii]AAG39639.1 biologically active peptide 4 [Mesobuthus martensii]AAK71696.1 venom peptide precursor [Mesobuthus martensii]ABY26703.1 NDBP11 [Lychas mucronatus]
MKSQTFFLLFLVVLLLAISQSEAFIGAVAGLLSKIFGKRSMRDMDTMKYLYDPSLSAADLKTLQKLMENY